MTNEDWVGWNVNSLVNFTGEHLFSSPEVKAQVSFSDRPLSVVCLSVCLLNIYIFNFFFRTAGPILTRLGTTHPWAKGIQNYTNEGQPPSPRGDNSERVQIH
jgi:hypothetical protein